MATSSLTLDLVALSSCPSDLVVLAVVSGGEWRTGEYINDDETKLSRVLAPFCFFLFPFFLFFLFPPSCCKKGRSIIEGQTLLYFLLRVKCTGGL